MLNAVLIQNFHFEVNNSLSYKNTFNKRKVKGIIVYAAPLMPL